MARDGAATKAKILRAAYLLFYRKGYHRVGVGDVALAAGATRRTLYHHFESKDELVAAALEFHQTLAMEQIMKWGHRLTGSPQEAIALLFSNLARWTEEPRWHGSGFTRLAMELADLPGHPARAVARAHKRSLEHWLTEVFGRLGAVEPGELARQVHLLTEGATALTLIFGGRHHVEAAGRAAQTLAAASRIGAPQQ